MHFFQLNSGPGQTKQMILVIWDCNWKSGVHVSFKKKTAT